MINSKNSFEEKKDVIKSKENINEIEAKENENPDSNLKKKEEKIEINDVVESKEIIEKKTKFSVKNEKIDLQQNNSEKTKNGNKVKINEKFFDSKPKKKFRKTKKLFKSEINMDKKRKTSKKIKSRNISKNKTYSTKKENFDNLSYLEQALKFSEAQKLELKNSLFSIEDYIRTLKSKIITHKKNQRMLPKQESFDLDKHITFIKNISDKRKKFVKDKINRTRNIFEKQIQKKKELEKKQKIRKMNMLNEKKERILNNIYNIKKNAVMRKKLNMKTNQIIGELLYSTNNSFINRSKLEKISN